MSEVAATADRHHVRALSPRWVIRPQGQFDDRNNSLQTHQILGLANGNDTLSYSYRWNAVSQITMPGNLTRTMSLDALQRATQIEVKGAGNSGIPVMDHRYHYDEVSNITEKTTLDGVYQYGYDVLDRLTQATPPESLQQSAQNPEGLPIESYSYDLVHNRQSSAHQIGAWRYNANNELLEWGSGAEKRQLTYDLNGSTIKEVLGAAGSAQTTTDYVYDAQDRLVEVKKNGATVAKYAYDPMGRRIWREASGQVTWFLYSDEGLMQEISSTNTDIRTYGWNPGGLWGTDTVWQKDANGVFLTNNDHLYTTDYLTKASDGAVAWSATRESFGRTSVAAGSQTEFLMRFPGQWEDAVGGFAQNYYRDYKFTTGRYAEVDQIGLQGGINFMAYAGQNPLSFLDPWGQDYWIEGSVPSEGGHPYHQSVCVGTRGAERLCISFGTTNEPDCAVFYFDCNGEVYIDDSAEGPLVDITYTPSDLDLEIARYFLSLVGQKGNYWLIGNSCRSFSWRIFQGLDRAHVRPDHGEYFWPPPPGYKPPERRGRKKK
jgi:RHS repeat-associated protein